MDTDRGTEQTLGRIRHEAVQYEIARYDANLARYSTLYYTLEAVTLAARRHAEANSIDDWDFQADLLRPGINVVDAIMWGVQKQDSPDEEKVKLWWHRHDLFDLVRADRALPLDRSSLEHATGLYLALPYREPKLDRMLADALVALEASAFADQMLNEKWFPELGPPASPLKKKHPFGIYLKGQLKNLAWMVAVVGGAVGLYAYGYLGGTGAFWSAAVWAALSALSFVLATAFLPTMWKRHAKAKDHVVMLMQEMLHCYDELQSSGPISARRLLERLKEADAKGVSWPAPLYALLDDVMARTGRL